MKKMIIAFALLVGFASMQAQNETESAVEVTGEATVKVMPDEVVIRSRMEHEGDNAREVKRENDKVVDAIISFLKGAGISEKDIQTDYMNLNKRYKYNNDTTTSTYVANQAISIHLRDLGEYERIMGGLLENGLNRIDGVEFKSSAIDSHESEARKMAVKNARKKAEEYAGALDQSIGKAIKISETESNVVQPMYRMAEMRTSDDSAGQSIAPGEIEFTARINVSFLLL